MLKHFLYILPAIFFLQTCGTEGTKGDNQPKALESGLNGTILSHSGEISELNGWNIVLMERYTNICRVNEIVDGTYSFKGTATATPYTLFLLSPDFKLKSVYATQAANPSKVHQYFQSSEASLPRLIFNGPVIEFDDDKNTELLNFYASSKNKNGVPDGMMTSEPSLLRGYFIPRKNTSKSDVDTDQDSIPNTQDPDISGNGIANIFDLDSDGDGVIDAFDEDANGDFISDSQEPFTNKYFFSRWFDKIVVQQRLEIIDSEPISVLYFMAKAKTQTYTNNTPPMKVSVRAHRSLFAGSTINATNTDGSTYIDSWDYSLKENKSIDNKIVSYEQKVYLKHGLHPADNQIVFIRVEVEVPKDKSYYEEFPFMLTHVNMEKVDATYSSGTNTFSLLNKPFGTGGGRDNFTWKVQIYDSQNKIIHFSSPLSSNNQVYQVPDNTLNSSETYYAKVYAQSAEVITNYPAMVSESSIIPL